ncbi:MAG: hypothetical protein Q9227_006754 [Pyrenula ochraceoflavens]
MNGFAEHGLDEDAFGEKKGLSGLKTFDAFPKTKPTYSHSTTRGGQFTLALIILSILFSISELRTWWAGRETYHFSVERGVSHELQLNLDIVVLMPCHDLHVNIQDAAGDRIMAGTLLRKDDTLWSLWGEQGRRKRRNRAGMETLNRPDEERRMQEEEDMHVGHVLGHMREGGRKFPKTPRLRRSETADSCRIYGSLEGNKVQGDFHITARGHGYAEWGAQHLDHGTFNFTHHISELSFGPHYPSLLNPLDRTTATTPTEHSHFHKFQYYLSIVPTIYTRRRVLNSQGTLDPASIPQPRTLDLVPHVGKDGKVTHVDSRTKSSDDSKTVFTNQYAAQSQSRDVSENTIPGIFFKYDIEPVLLVVAETRPGILGLLVRLVNVVSGILVGGGWVYQIWEWGGENVWGRRRRTSGIGVGGGMLFGGEKH